MSLNPLNYEYEWAAIVALIAASIALYGSWRANKIAEKNLALAAEMEIIKFREKWISELRDRFADFLSFTTFKQIQRYDVERDVSKGDWLKLNQLFSQILLLMNPNDEQYISLRNCMSNELKAIVSDEYDESQKSSLFLEISQSILKREWERLKQDKDKLKEI